MSDDPRRLLEEAGSRPTPDPDPAFADALDARLRAVAASRPATEGGGDGAPGRPPDSMPDASRRRRVAGVLGALAIGAVVVAVAVSGLGSPTPSTATLDVPVNVVVALADGTVLEDPAGVVLPEGAVITVGEGGSARIGSTVLDPGDVATVRDGRIDVRHPETGVVSSPDAGRPTGAAPSPGATTRVEPTVAPTRSPVASQGSAPATAPASRSPKPTESAASTAANATATPSPTPAIRRPRLRARLLETGRIAVTWTATERARGYVLVITRSRSGPARDPVYPGSRVIGEFGEPPPKPIRLRVPDGVVEVRLMVVALRRDGSVLRRSNIVTITIPASGDTTGTIAGASSDPPASVDAATPAASSATPATDPSATP